jgi:hypothetical protein
MANPITVQLAKGIAKSLLNVVLNVGLFYEGVQFFENFILNNFDVILGNTFLDAYKINIFYNRSKLKVYAKISSKLVDLDVEYNFTLAKMGVKLVALANELKLSSFLVLMSLKVSQGEPKPQGASQPPTCILDSFNKFLEVLRNKLMNVLPPCREVDHLIIMMPRATPLS